MTNKYALGHTQSTISSHESRTAEVDAAFLLPHLKSNFRILDVGCGPGSITRGFCKYVPDGKVIGVDIMEGVLEKARKGAEGGIYPNLEFQSFDITKPLGSERAIPAEWRGAFDVIYESQCMIHLPDPVGTIRNLKQCLKPGGVFASRGFDPATFTFWRDPGGRLANWAKLMQTMVAKSEGAPPAGGRELPFWHAEAGLNVDEGYIGGDATTYSGATQRKWWGEIQAGRFGEGEPVRESLIRDCGVTAVECDEVREALLDFSKTSDGYFFCMSMNVLSVNE